MLRDHEDVAMIVWKTLLHAQLPRDCQEKGPAAVMLMQRTRLSRDRYPRALKVSHSGILEISAWLLINSSRSWYSGSPKNPCTVGPQEGATAFPWKGLLKRRARLRAHSELSAFLRPPLDVAIVPRRAQERQLMASLSPFLLPRQGPGGSTAGPATHHPCSLQPTSRGGGRGLPERVCPILQKTRLPRNLWGDRSQTCRRFLGLQEPRSCRASKPGPHVPRIWSSSQTLWGHQAHRTLRSQVPGCPVSAHLYTSQRVANGKSGQDCRAHLGRPFSRRAQGPQFCKDPIDRHPVDALSCGRIYTARERGAWGDSRNGQKFGLFPVLCLTQTVSFGGDWLCWLCL